MSMSVDLDTVPRGKPWIRRWWRSPGESLLVGEGFSATLKWSHATEFGVDVAIGSEPSREMVFDSAELFHTQPGIPASVVQQVRTNIQLRFPAFGDPTKSSLLAQIAAQLKSTRWVSGHVLRRILSLSFTDFDRQATRLQPRYLARKDTGTSDYYSLTLPALHAFEETLGLDVTTEHVYRAVARVVNLDPAAQTITMEDLHAVGCNTNDVALVGRIGRLAQLLGAHRRDELGLPVDKEEIEMAHRDGKRFLEYIPYSATQSVNGRYMIQRPWHCAPLWLNSDGESSDFTTDHDSTATSVAHTTQLKALEPNRYALNGPIGEGRYAEVFRATDRRLGREVAVKFVRRDVLGATAIEHARALTRVEHANIVRVYDVTVIAHPTTGEPSEAVVMELVEGMTLTEVLGRDMSTQQLLALADGLIEGIRAYHATNRAHLDLHDANVIVTPTGVKLLDPLFFDTAVLASTATREHQQRRDLIGIRDILTQAIMLVYDEDAVLRFERMTLRPTLDRLRTSLLELPAKTTEPPTKEQENKGSLSPPERVLMALIGIADATGETGYARFNEKTLTGAIDVPSADLSDLLTIMAERDWVRVQRALGVTLPVSLEITHIGREQAHNLGAEIPSPAADAETLVDAIKVSGRTRETLSLDRLQELTGWTAARIIDAARSLESTGRAGGKLLNNRASFRLMLTPAGRIL